MCHAHIAVYYAFVYFVNYKIARNRWPCHQVGVVKYGYTKTLTVDNKRKVTITLLLIGKCTGVVYIIFIQHFMRTL